MQNTPEHKLYIGLGGFMLRIPSRLAAKGARKGETGAKANADRLSTAERRVHHFIVMKMAVVDEPMTAESIASELEMPAEEVQQIVAKLESLKTFLYRDDGTGINWAYPLSLANTGFRMSASSGERFFAA